MSRFGRNYLQVGFYTEMLFPDKGVRFIAVNNNIDSDNPTDNEFIPFLNIMNEWYAKDTSKKIRAVFRNRMENGQRCSGSVPYGYKKMPGDKQNFYVDPEAAAVVKRIFQMAADAVPMGTIAQTLTDERIPIPSAYAETHEGVECHNHSYNDPYRWTSTSVKYILERQEYLGHTVLGKMITENFKTKKRRKATEDELFFFPDTHEAIIDQETWDRAQKLINRRPRRLSNGRATHRLSGMMFCADCGARLSYTAPDSEHCENRTIFDSMSSFQCSHYRNVNYQCTSHFIKASTVEEAIRYSLRAVTRDVLQDEEAFAARLLEQWNKSHNQVSEDQKKELAAAKRRVDELDLLIKGLYENQAKGLIPDRQFQKLMAQYDEEQIKVEGRVAELEAPTAEKAPKKVGIERFTSLIRQYRSFEEVTDDMLYALIERIDVHAGTGRGNNREQQIDIYFSFIGSYIPTVDPEEEAARLKSIEDEKNDKIRQAKIRENERRNQHRRDLKERAKTDPEAAAEYEAMLALSRKRNAEYRTGKVDPEILAEREKRKRLSKLRKLKIRELEPLAADNPDAAEILRQKREKHARDNKRNAERKKERKANDSAYAEHRRQKEAEYVRNTNARRAALKEAARTDTEAAEQYEALLEREAASREKSTEKKKKRTAEDPEFAAEQAVRKKEYTKRRTAKRKAERDELKRLAAEGDEEAARKLAKMRAYGVAASTKSRKKLEEQAKIDPNAARKLEAKKQKKRDDANRRYAELKEAAETDPEAARKLAEKRSRGLEATNRYNENLRKLAEEGVSEAAFKLITQQEYNRDYLRDYYQKKKEVAEREAV